MTDNTNSNTNPTDTSAADAVAPAAPAAPAAPKHQRGRPIDPNGGMGRAREYYATLTTLAERQDRDAVVQAFLNLNPPLTAGTAAAYYSVIRRPEREAEKAAKAKAKAATATV